MTTNLTLALQITAIGMGLVFAAILLLWALMAGLVRLLPERPEAPARVAPETAAPPGVRSLRRQAAALAVAAALALDAVEPDRPPQGAGTLPATAFVSAWQAVMRANQLRQRGQRR